LANVSRHVVGYAGVNWVAEGSSWVIAAAKGGETHAEERRAQVRTERVKIEMDACERRGESRTRILSFAERDIGKGVGVVVRWTNGESN
jgi:hypothetical protein